MFLPYGEKSAQSKRTTSETFFYDLLELLGKIFPLFAQVAMKLDIPHKDLLAGRLIRATGNVEVAAFGSCYMRIEKNAAFTAISLGIGIQLVKIAGIYTPANTASGEPFPLGVQNKSGVVPPGPL